MLPLFVLLIVFTVLIFLSTTGNVAWTIYKTSDLTRLERSKQIDNVIFVNSIAIWSLIFFGICFMNPLERINQNIFAIVGFLWPVVLLLSRMVHVQHDQKESSSESHVQHNDTRGSAGLLFTAAFGIGVILTSLKKDANPLGSKLVLMSLLFCVAFLIPTNAFPVESHISHGIRTFQSCMTQIAIGMFIIGISVSYFTTKTLTQS